MKSGVQFQTFSKTGAQPQKCDQSNPENCSNPGVLNTNLFFVSPGITLLVWGIWLLLSSTSIGNKKNKTKQKLQAHSHMETIQKQVQQINPIINLLLCNRFLMRCYCRSVFPSGTMFSAKISSNQVTSAASLLSVFHFTSIFNISLLMLPHMFVFFHIRLHQVSYLHRVDLSTFAVADLRGIRQGIQSVKGITTAQEDNKWSETLSFPEEPTPAKALEPHTRARKADNSTRIIKFSASIRVGLSSVVICKMYNISWPKCTWARHIKLLSMITAAIHGLS